MHKKEEVRISFALQLFRQLTSTSYWGSQDQSLRDGQGLGRTRGGCGWNSNDSSSSSKTSIFRVLYPETDISKRSLALHRNSSTPRLLPTNESARVSERVYNENEKRKEENYTLCEMMVSTG